MFLFSCGGCIKSTKNTKNTKSTEKGEGNKEPKGQERQSETIEIELRQAGLFTFMSEKKFIALLIAYCFIL